MKKPKAPASIEVYLPNKEGMHMIRFETFSDAKDFFEHLIPADYSTEFVSLELLNEFDVTYSTKKVALAAFRKLWFEQDLSSSPNGIFDTNMPKSF